MLMNPNTPLAINPSNSFCHEVAKLGCKPVAEFGWGLLVRYINRLGSVSLNQEGS